MSNCYPCADPVPVPPPHRVILGGPWCVEGSSRALCPGEWSVVPCLASRESTQTCAITKAGSRRRCRATDDPLPPTVTSRPRAFAASSPRLWNPS